MECKCGGKLIEVRYLNTKGSIDDDYFVDQFLYKCDKCKSEIVIEEDVET